MDTKKAFFDQLTDDEKSPSKFEDTILRAVKNEIKNKYSSQKKRQSRSPEKRAKEINIYTAENLDETLSAMDAGMGRAKFEKEDSSKLGFFVGKGSSNLSHQSKEKEEKKQKKKNENHN